MLIVPGNQVIAVIHIHQMQWRFLIETSIALQDSFLPIVVLEVTETYFFLSGNSSLNSVDVVEHRFILRPDTPLNVKVPS